jgi:hypothetical protein
MVILLLVALLQPGAAPMRTLDQGSQSGIDEARQVIVRSASEWTALWRVHSPDRARPDVDFSREMIVGVFMGSRPTAGFAIEIRGTRESGGVLIVQYRETLPPARAMTAQILTMPYHLVAIPTRPGEVKFEKVE